MASIRLSSGEAYTGKGTRRLPPETLIHLDLPGGGGFFDPLTRDPELVRADVTAGVVSVEGARSDYGVAIDAAISEIDWETTNRLREAAGLVLAD
jgi:N-methylhydantoinase B